MNEYKKNLLKEYIDTTSLITINDNLKIRLSSELLDKYNQGKYTSALKQISNNINEINKLGIKYPANSKPIFYIYIVPNENFRELLNYPLFRNSNGGGKPVMSYDLDGFNSAYGSSSNKLEDRGEFNIMQIVNNIHELAHLVHGMFFNKDRLISEGFAEAFPLYTMDYESKFDEHRDMIKNLKEENILTAKELIKLANEREFNAGSFVPNKSCAFDVSYVSAYLFVRGCLEMIANKFNIDRVAATQKFLEILKQTTCINEWLIFEIADALEIDKEQLLNGKEMQTNVIKGI